jgi:twitching motility protein PilT
MAQLVDVLCTKRLAQDIRAHQKRIHVFKALAEHMEDKALFLPYIRALKSGGSAVRAAVAEFVPKVHAYEEHPKLAVLLKSDDSEIRKTAAEVLKKIGGKTVLKLLQNMVTERDFPGRSETIDVVIPIAGHYAAPVLKAILEVGKPQEKLKALKFLGDERYMSKAKGVALRYILPAIDDPGEKIAAQAIRSFSNLATENDYFEYIAPLLDETSVTLVKAAVEGLGHFCSPRSIMALERKLRAGPNIIRLEVLSTLETIGRDEVLPLLVEALGHQQVTIRNQAAEVLTRLSKSGKIDMARTVIWLLQSRDVNVRRMAVEVARKVKDPDGELWPKLLNFLRDEDWWVRERVKDALVEMAGKKLTPHMVGLLKDPFDVVRRFAVDVLILLSDPKALGALINTAREDEDWWAREKAIEAMAVIKDERAVPYLVDLMRRGDEVQFACVQALERLEAKSAAPYVAELLTSPDADIRCAAIRCLGKCHALEMADKIQPLRADENPRVMRAAEEQLIRWNVELSETFTVSKDKAVSFLDRMLLTVVEAEADDLVVESNRKPYMKRLGQMVPISKQALTHEQVVSILTPHLSYAQMAEMESLNDIDFSYEVHQRSQRFRVNVFHQRTGLAAVFRIIKGELPDLDRLGLPDVVKGFGDLRHGLVLVGGPTGSGKSTTLAALIDYINRTSDRHVISLEDPIEVVHKSKRGLVNQREIGTHTPSFGHALRSTLREDPDVILVGEMRDLETIAFAVSAAETGHLVFGTVHTVSADTSIDRILNTFPPGEQPQVRSTLAENLRAVTCQYLIKRLDKPGRVLAAEVMLNTDAIASLIRNGKTYQIPSVIATSRELGMQLMDNELMRLYKEGKISADEAYVKSSVKKEFEEIAAGEKGDDAGDIPPQMAPPSLGGRDEDALSLPMSEAEQELYRQRR